MRQGNNNRILLTSDGQVLGVSLGADFCAEHEWGIKGLNHMFGTGSLEEFGLARRKITQNTADLVWVERKQVLNDFRTKKKEEVPCGGFWTKSKYCDEAFPRDVNFYAGDWTLWTGWSERDFGVFGIRDKVIAQIKEVFEHILELDAAVWLGGGGVFQNAGLSIAIASRLSAEVTEMWDRVDREHAQLTADAEATGIAARLKAAGLNWFALSPSRDKDGSVHFWLNPYDQRNNNYGWFTVQDLDDWIAGRGKVPKGKSTQTIREKR